MFCGKTEELIRRLRRAVIARQKVQVFKPIIDNRYQVAKVASHSGVAFEVLPIEKSSHLMGKLNPETTVVGIDEVQFFDAGILSVIQKLVDDGKRVICAGLDTDFRGEPFGVMPTIMAIAEHVDKLQAICMVCGEPASRTQRLVNGEPAYFDDPIIIVGASEMYEARCRLHHKVPKK
jgi:thymidine kinase